MEFHSISALVRGPQDAAADQSPKAATGKQQLVKMSQNLLNHIPGEASGFYLMAVDAFADPSLSVLGVLCFLALVLLVAVRWLAGASRGIMITTVGAYVLWMLILDQGFLHRAFPDLLQDPLGLVIAGFYSALVTILAGAGKIR